jgi:hypothetical protein
MLGRASRFEFKSDGALQHPLEEYKDLYGLGVREDFLPYLETCPTRIKYLRFNFSVEVSKDKTERMFSDLLRKSVNKVWYNPQVSNDKLSDLFSSMSLTKSNKLIDRLKDLLKELPEVKSLRISTKNNLLSTVHKILEEKAFKNI